MTDQTSNLEPCAICNASTDNISTYTINSIRTCGETECIDEATSRAFKPLHLFRKELSRVST